MTLPIPILIMMIGPRLPRIPTPIGPISIPLLVHAFWEPFFAIGAIGGILLAFRKFTQHSSKTWDYLSRGAYLVYIIHPVINVTVGVLLKAWPAYLLLKFVCTGTLTCVSCWLIAGPILRIPVFRKLF